MAGEERQTVKGAMERDEDRQTGRQDEGGVETKRQTGHCREEERQKVERESDGVRGETDS